MSTFIVTALRLGFLALIWVFILITANVIRTDMFGRRVPARTGNAPNSPQIAPAAEPPRAKRRRGAPVRLTVTEGADAGAQIPLFDGLVIGRARDTDLVISDTYASGHHARLNQDSQGHWILTDEESTNGTRVNDAWITAPTIVTRKDDIRIGDTHLRLEK